MNERRIAAFFQLAEESLKSANLLCREDQFRDAAYLAQQVAERITRALLEHADVPFGTSHNLGQMAASLPPEHPFRQRIADLDVLSPAATKYRYPGASGRIANPPPTEELRSILDVLAELLETAKAYVHGRSSMPSPPD